MEAHRCRSELTLTESGCKDGGSLPCSRTKDGNLGLPLPASESAFEFSMEPKLLSSRISIELLREEEAR